MDELWLDKQGTKKFHLVSFKYFKGYAETVFVVVVVAVCL